MVSEDPWNGAVRANTTTLKFGRDYDAPWLVLAGTVESMRSDLIAALGWDGATLTEATLADLITAASRQLQAEYAVTTQLGGSRVSSEPLNRGRGKAAKGATADAPQEAVEAPVEAAQPEVEASPHANILEALEGAASAADVKRVFVQNKTVFADSTELQDAFKAAMVRTNESKGN